jgi:hypothetical protein
VNASSDSSPTPHRKLRHIVSAAAAAAVGLCLVGLALAGPRPFRALPGTEYENFELPPDYMNPAEWTFARLMYPTCHSYYMRGCYRSEGDDWKLGGTSWTIDFPRADRHLAQIVRRLTNIDARSVEQSVDLDDGDEVFYWPWLYAVEVGHWELTDQQVVKLREYLTRGGFLMVDDFHGTDEWAVFLASIQRVFPDRPIVDIPNDDQIFHIFWDLDDRIQVPGAQFMYSGRTSEKDGYTPRWRGIYDDKGRVMVAICHNMDLGDSIEHNDTPGYPEKYSAQGMRTYLNYIIYAMTH